MSRRLRRIVLDTSAYSHFRAGHPEMLTLLAHAEEIAMPVIVIGELEAAFLGGRRVTENQRALQEFLEEPFVTLVPLTTDIARRYGRIFSALKRAGTPIPVNDVWIAATAMEHGGELVTFDGDFASVAGLAITLLRASRE